MTKTKPKTHLEHAMYMYHEIRVLCPNSQAFWNDVQRIIERENNPTKIIAFQKSKNWRKYALTPASAMKGHDDVRNFNRRQSKKKES